MTELRVLSDGRSKPGLRTTSRGAAGYLGVILGLWLAFVFALFGLGVFVYLLVEWA